MNYVKEWVVLLTHIFRGLSREITDFISCFACESTRTRFLNTIALIRDVAHEKTKIK
jgi:hypothetical protein